MSRLPCEDFDTSILNDLRALVIMESMLSGREELTEDELDVIKAITARNLALTEMLQAEQARSNGDNDTFNQHANKCNEYNAEFEALKYKLQAFCDRLDAEDLDDE